MGGAAETGATEAVGAGLVPARLSGNAGRDKPCPYLISGFLCIHFQSNYYPFSLSSFS